MKFKMKKIFDYIFNRILHLNLSENVIEETSQFVCFGIVGLSNTLISYIVYVLCITCGMNYLIASVFGFLISVLNAFYWNNKFVFKKQQEEERSCWQAFIKTFISYAGTGLVLNNILLVMWIDFLQMNELAAPILNLLITIPLNYLLNKFWAFKEIR